MSDGGLAVALAEMAIAGECGFAVGLGSELVPSLAWFSESASRVVVTLDPQLADDLVERARTANVPAQRLGTAGGDRLVADGAFAVTLADATTAWRDALPTALQPNISKLTASFDPRVRDVRRFGRFGRWGPRSGLQSPCMGYCTR